LAAIAACGGGDPASWSDAPDPDAALGDDASQPTQEAGLVDTGPVPAEFGLDVRPANATCKVPARPPSNVPVKFERVYQNLTFDQPMVALQRPGDPSRWYLVERLGRIVHFPTLNPTTTTQAVNLNFALPGPTVTGAPGVVAAGEGGLLGFAFHPKFAQNGKAYVSLLTYARANPSEPDSFCQSTIGELTSTDGGNTFSSYKTILIFDQTAAGNHKGGGLAFGKDGYLYASFGDGGNGGDAFVKAQKKGQFFGKIIRIDVDKPEGGKPYGIPSDNPFKDEPGAEPSTFAYGFRNPWRISIDRDTGDLWASDVGDLAWEELDRVKIGGNYGWPCRQGAHDYVFPPDTRCPNNTNLIDPIFDYERAPAGGAVTGGLVYRGKAIPSFVGSYVFGDAITGELRALVFDPTTGDPKSVLLNPQGPTGFWTGFNEDDAGELYALALVENAMHKLVPSPGAPVDTFPDRLSKTACVDPSDPKKVASGLVPFGVNAQLWSDGATKDRFVALPDNAKITVKPDGDFDLPIGSVVMKSFKIDGKLIETRLLMRHDDGGWAGYTYEWNEAQTDAVLLRGSKTKTIGTRAWHYPSGAECARCHTEAAGRTLGLELGQLNGDLVYGSTNRIANQLKTLDHIGYFSAPLGKPPSELPLIPSPEGAAPLDARARAYLHANCAHCHQKNATPRTKLDLRFSTTLKDSATCNVAAELGDVGVAGAKLLVPGAPKQSVLSLRPHAIDVKRMPPLATSVVDTQGLGVVDAWITSLTTCPQ